LSTQPALMEPSLIEKPQHWVRNLH
jgi:hypothetical protein